MTKIIIQLFTTTFFRGRSLFFLVFPPCLNTRMLKIIHLKLGNFINISAVYVIFLLVFLKDDTFDPQYIKISNLDIIVLVCCKLSHFCFISVWSKYKFNSLIEKVLLKSILIAREFFEFSNNSPAFLLAFLYA